jgi:hypothetical protein
VIQRTPRQVRRRRCVGILWFIAVTLPLVFFLGAVSTDTMRVISARRQAGQLADAASLAGAIQFAQEGDDRWDGTGRTLDPFEVERAVTDHVAVALDAGVAPLLDDVIVSHRLTNTAGVDTVEVMLEFRVNGLVFFDIATGNSDNSAVNGKLRRSSSVCAPDTQLDGQGCARPRI